MNNNTNYKNNNNNDETNLHLQPNSVKTCRLGQTVHWRPEMPGKQGHCPDTLSQTPPIIVP